MNLRMTSMLSTTAFNFSHWCVLFMLFSLCCLPVLSADTITFTFAPPDGMTYTETTRTKTTAKMTAGEHSDKEVTEEILKTKTEINKTADGYAITEIILSVDDTRDGNAIDSEPFKQAMVGIPLIYHTDKTGKLLSIDGIDRAVQCCQETMPPNKLRSSGYLATAEGILDANKASWYEDTESLVTRSVKAGDTWKISFGEPLPNSKKDTINELYNMVAREVKNGHDAIRVHYVKQHDLHALSGAGAFYFKQLADSKEDIPTSVTVKQMTENGVVLLDPNTLQLLSSYSTTTVVTQLTGPNGEKMVISEQSVEQSTVDYDTGASTGG